MRVLLSLYGLEPFTILIIVSLAAHSARTTQSAHNTSHRDRSTAEINCKSLNVLSARNAQFEVEIFQLDLWQAEWMDVGRNVAQVKSV